ncbi:Rz-like spanin [Edwardsiella phage PEi21]|uniref:Putative inner membrane spanin subunit n=1 Tax=Edwardsiella phage PEi21 TaxID=1325372 RepID=N0DUA5_9CAUD|nr:Rz-like spanin [Edwardsiella phage PEi21]QXV72959.1 inner membrane spanin subunit [Edwardsiella phage PVN06]BAN16857.1 putative inner membrane spanin subunit [Edwardsiella phage PEi21]
MKTALAILLVVVAVFTMGFAAGKNSVKVEQLTDTVNTQQIVSNVDRVIAIGQEAVTVSRLKKTEEAKVIYVDRIKTVTVRDCVRDSGVLKLYDTSLGLSDGKL